MPGVKESCRAFLGICPGIADETEITQSHAPPPPPAAVPPPPESGPPRFLLEDAWPWLALLGILALAALLVWLFVFNSRGSKGRTVPAVVGRPQQTAVAELQKDGFGVKEIIGPSRRPRGIVASQVPGGGSRLDKGQTVTINVSNGRPLVTPSTNASTTTTSATTTAATTTTAAAQSVPDVGGQDLASAAGQVEAAGFVAETDPVTASGAPGSVVQEDPAAGTQAPAGSIVKLSVAVGSNRPPTQVPDVVGQQAPAARATLLEAKLTVRTVYKHGKLGVVLAETPTGTAPAYTQVTLTVGR
jgi:eukaryotic-like serine/threonine-protein kinase